MMHLQIFIGNSDRNTSRKQLLCSPIVTSRLRIIVEEHHGSCCMRVGIYGVPLTQGKFHFMQMMPRASFFKQVDAVFHSIIPLSN